MELWFILGLFGYMLYAVSSCIDNYMMNQRYHPVTTGCCALLFNTVILGTIGLLFLNLRHQLYYNFIKPHELIPNFLPN